MDYNKTIRGVKVFVDRYDELEILNNEYSKEGLSFSVLYGRRRVGKTSLLKEYVKDKPAIYFLSTMENASILREKLQFIIADFFEDNLMKTLIFKDFVGIFEYIASKEIVKKLVVIIDEFQYLGKEDSSVPSQFQYIVDETIKSKNIHLVLCGSIISMMYEQTLSYSSPLYGRRTSSIKLEPIEFCYLNEFFPTHSQEQLLELYSIFYGVPKYLEMIEPKKNIFENIKDNILSPSSYLYNEPQFILQHEVNEPVTYFSILEIIANGEHKIGNIASRLVKNANGIMPYLSKLIELDIIYKEVPITEENPVKSKKGLYFIKDNFFRFWFRYVLPFKSQLEIGNSEYVLHKIKQNFNAFVGQSYEKLAVSYVAQYFNTLKCGRYWNKNIEIDIVGITDSSLIVGECKYSNKKVGIDVFDNLKQKAKTIESQLPIKCCILFSKSGFTDELLKMQEENLVLIELLSKRM